MTVKAVNDFPLSSVEALLKLKLVNYFPVFLDVYLMIELPVQPTLLPVHHDRSSQRDTNNTRSSR